MSTTLKLSALTLLFPLFAVAQSNRPPLPQTANNITRDLPIYEMNQAKQLVMWGRTEEAIVAYDAMLARVPNWIPVMTEKAQLLFQTGRDKEAQKILHTALRIDPLATNFYSARRGFSLLPYIALYPRAWFEDKYGGEKQLAAVRPVTTLFEYQQIQMDLLSQAATEDPAIELLLLKSRGETLALDDLLDLSIDVQSRQWLDLTLGNLALLRYDLLPALQFYNDAVLSGANWPELYYNRGLVNILLTNYPDGCADLQRSAGDGLKSGDIMFRSLCNF